MKNFRNSGQEVTHTVVSTDKLSGDVVVLNFMCGILAMNAKVGEQVSVEVEGVFEVKKKAAVTFAIGEKVYWHATDGATATNTDAKMGVATRAAAGADATCYVKLVPCMT